MTTEEAKEILANTPPEDIKNNLQYGFAIAMAQEALTKQIPKKPKIKYGELHNTHNLGRLMSFYCPYCGKHIVSMYENDVERGGGISRKLRGCSRCLTAIDFTEYYCKEKNEKYI